MANTLATRVPAIKPCRSQLLVMSHFVKVESRYFSKLENETIIDFSIVIRFKIEQNRHNNVETSKQQAN